MNDNPQWAPDHTLFFIMRHLVPPGCKSQEFYSRVLRQPPNYMMESRFTCDYVYERLGRPKWFVDRECFDLLVSLKIETDDLTGIHIPHDAFSLIFEKGCVVDGLMFRSLRIHRIASKLTHQFLSEVGLKVVDHPNHPLRKDMLFMVIDNGRNAKTGEYVWDVDPRDAGWAYYSRKLNAPPGYAHTYADMQGNPRSRPISETDQKKVEVWANRIFMSAMLYAAARPDCVSEFTLPRSCRYNYKGEKSTYRRMLCPRAAPQAGGEKGEATGRGVTPHYRGWVLATLRAERYKRNPDGTCRVVLREPCAVLGGAVPDA